MFFLKWPYLFCFDHMRTCFFWPSGGTLLSCVCPLRLPWTTTSSWPPSPLVVRSCPTTTPASSLDGDAPRVSGTSRYSTPWINLLCVYIQQQSWHVFLCRPQPEVSSLLHSNRRLCLLSTTRPAPATAGGAARWRPPWCVLVAAETLDVRWVRAGQSLYIMYKKYMY